MFKDQIYSFVDWVKKYLVDTSVARGLYFFIITLCVVVNCYGKKVE